MKKKDMRCGNCDYYAPGEARTSRTLRITLHGECRRRPPSMIQSEEVEFDPVPVFDDTASLRAPLRRLMIHSVFVPVNQQYWCGEGRWTDADGAKVFWGQGEEREDDY